MKAIKFTLDDWATFGFWCRIRKKFSYYAFERTKKLCHERGKELDWAHTSWLNLHGPRVEIQNAMEAEGRI